MAQAALSEPINALQELLLQHSADKPQKQGLRVGALNAESVTSSARLQAVQRLIKNNGLDIFAIIETWLKDSDTIQLNLEGYSYVRKDRRYAIKKEEGKPRIKTKNTGRQTQPNSTRGGGILIYIHESVNYKVKSRGEYAESNVEFLHIEITSPVQLHLVALYSPEKILVGHLISLMSYFMEPLGDKKIMFIGDTNINTYSDEGDDRLGNTFFRALSQKYEVKQFIDHRTHDTAHIDHIFTNLPVLESGMISNKVAGTTIGSHKGIYCTLSVSESFWVLKNQLSKELQQSACGACLLATFCEVAENEAPPATNPVLQFFDGVSLVYYMAFDDADDIDFVVHPFQTIVDEINPVDSITNKKWTIFTKSPSSDVYNPLKEAMIAHCTSFTWEANELTWKDIIFDQSLAYGEGTSSETSYDKGGQDEQQKVQNFMKRLTNPLLKEDTCILAVFYQFSKDASDKQQEANVVLTYPQERELACYITVDGVGAVKDKIQSIEEYTKLVKDEADTHKQCIIFTRNSQSRVFHALQKEMWYKDWDFVWQPRHVEFFGYVLEPSLTYAFRIKGGNPVWNIPKKEKKEDKEKEQKKAIALQECTYRYWLKNVKNIERL